LVIIYTLTLVFTPLHTPTPNFLGINYLMYLLFPWTYLVFLSLPVIIKCSLSFILIIVWWNNRKQRQLCSMENLKMNCMCLKILCLPTITQIILLLKSSYTLWHNRFGHVNARIIYHILKQCNVPLQVPHTFCESCVLGKSH